MRSLSLTMFVPAMLVIGVTLAAHSKCDEPPMPPTAATGAKLEVLYDETDGAKRFFEGPSFDPKSGVLYFTAFGKDASQILKVDAAGKVSVWMDKTDGINGTFIGLRGNNAGCLLGCQGNKGRVVRIPIGSDGRPGEIELLAESFDGKRLTAPNDIVEDLKGGIYFTDPDFGEKKTSAVYYITPAGKLTRVVADMPVPNGIYVAKGGLQLYVSDSDRLHVRAYPINPINGEVNEQAGRDFFKYPGAAADNKNPPDGMTLDERGNAYFTGRGGVSVVDPGGAALGVIAIPEFVSNCTFGGRDGRTLYMTCQNRVYKLAMNLRGAELASRHEFAANEPLKFRTTVLDKAFRSEGVAVADVNKDGRLDILVSDLWFEAPEAARISDPAAWKPHEIRPPADYDGTKGYSRGFGSWSDDWNGDGFPDVIVIPFPGQQAHWYENPKGQHTNSDGSVIHWKEHLLWHSACNETPTFKPLVAAKPGSPAVSALVMAWQPPGKENEGVMSYFLPPAKGQSLWQEFAVSGLRAPYTGRYSHGLGIGDVNGDGKNDIVCPAGWWQQPAANRDGKVPDGEWKFHPGNLNGGEAGAVADMHVFDINGDGTPDVVSSSAHRYGMWWFQQIRPSDGNGESTWRQHLIDDSFSQTHALQFADLNGDGVPDLITGSRFYAHQGHDPGEQGPVVLYWYEIKRTGGAGGGGGDVQFVRHMIDLGVGIGTQFVVQDINGDGRPDIVVSNKRGVFVLEQQPAK